MKKLKNTLTGIILSLGMAACGPMPAEHHLEFTNREGTKYDLQLEVYQDAIFVKDEGQLHFKEPSSSTDFIVQEGDYLVFTDGTPLQLEGHAQSVTSIYRYAQYNKDGVNEYWMEFFQVGDPSAFHVTTTGESLNGYRFASPTIGNTRHIIYVENLETCALAPDLNGFSAHPEPPHASWGDKVLITTEDGSMIDLEQLQRELGFAQYNP